MARGFVLGAIWGTVVAGVGAGAMSLMLGSPDRSVQPEVGLDAAMLSDPEPMETAADMPDTDATETAAQGAAAPEPLPATAPDTPPEAQAEAAPDPADAVGDAPVAATTPESGQGAPAQVPNADSGVDVPTEVASAPAEPDTPGTPQTDAEPPAAPVVGAAPGAPQITTPEDSAAAVTVAEAEPVQTAEAMTAPETPEPDAGPQVSTEPAAPPAVPETVTSGAEPAEDAAPAETVTPEAQPADDVAVTDEAEAAPAGLMRREPAVPQGRLPSIGDAPAAAVAAAPAISSDSPLVRYAAKVAAAPDDLPRMAFVLIDDGSGPLGPEALDGFPFPLTFAIAPGHPDAVATAQAYRDHGFEVMAMADVPEGASASDVEVIMAGTLDSIPGAIGVVEDPAGGVQSSREISNQVTAYLAETGHGIVMMPKGLNTAQQLALKAGVPSATLFRDFDAEGQDARAIRRTLDQAAFRAAQEGAVVMLGRLRADTISALVLWGLQDRASTVALVPVSRVLEEAAAL
ncbi:divergent polysaccharide deacetylase family protein [Tropicibacter sp. S64]|uniref:divergent polysaccharide deacetylase family protein n=1 Tax=Tropicibacter sp. S64 TaxID=3415122 RepID=UPI003C7A13E7